MSDHQVKQADPESFQLRQGLLDLAGHQVESARSGFQGEPASRHLHELKVSPRAAGKGSVGLGSGGFELERRAGRVNAVGPGALAARVLLLRRWEPCGAGQVLGPMNSSRSATLFRWEIEMFRQLERLHRIPSRSQASQKICWMSVE